MAKDVVTFLSWAAEPEHDERKKMGLQAVIILSALTAISLYTKRFKWSVIKNRKICEPRESTFCPPAKDLTYMLRLQSTTHQNRTAVEDLIHLTFLCCTLISLEVALLFVYEMICNL